MDMKSERRERERESKQIDTLIHMYYMYMFTFSIFYQCFRKINEKKQQQPN